MKPNRINSGFLTNTMRNIIGKQFPVCPLCGAYAPSWTFQYKISNDRIQFRCSECDSVYSVTRLDMMGVPKLQQNRNFFVLLYTWPLTLSEKISKKIHRKDIHTVYVKIEKLGYVADSPVRNGQEVPLHALQKLASKYH